MTDTAIVIIGVGAIGRQVAQLVVAMGATQVCLIDDDIVGVENLAVQGYYPSDLGEPKVNAAADVLKQVNPETKLVLHHRLYGGDIDPMVGGNQKHLAVFCCVDAIGTRSFIWKTLFESTHTKNLDFWADGRMAAEALRVFAWKKGQDKKKYEETLFPSDEAYHASCTGRSTLYSSYVIAGLMVGEFVKWMREQHVTINQSFSLLASEHGVDE